jgi:hypothetical protein
MACRPQNDSPPADRTKLFPEFRRILLYIVRITNYAIYMIRSCNDADTQKLVNRQPCKKFASIEKAARMSVGRLDAATSLKDLSEIQAIAWKRSKGIAKASTAFGSTIETGSASCGKTEPKTWKLWYR